MNRLYRPQKDFDNWRADCFEGHKKRQCGSISRMGLLGILVIGLTIISIWLVVNSTKEFDDRPKSMAPPPLNVEVTVKASDQIEVLWHVNSKDRQIDLGPLETTRLFKPVADQSDHPHRRTHRGAEWRIDNQDWHFRTREGRLWLEFSGSGAATPPEVSIKHVFSLREHGYRVLYQARDQGLILYTGAIWPWQTHNRRRKVEFTFELPEDASLCAFGTCSSAISAWQSPYNHPAFVGLGRFVVDFENPTLVDVPPWIADEISTLSPQIQSALTRGFSTGHLQDITKRPDLYAIYWPKAHRNGSANRLSMAGDVLPGQVMLSMIGEAWQMPSPSGRDIVRRVLTHELVHVWQADIRPVSRDVPAWIHEGAAEAIAAETLQSIGVWSAAQKIDYDLQARSRCADGLAGQPLNRLKADRRVHYACGHVLAIAAAKARILPTKTVQQSPTPVTVFWRDFIAHTKASGVGYSLQAWLSFIDGDQPGPRRSQSIRRFIENAVPVPGPLIDQLIAGSP